MIKQDDEGSQLIAAGVCHEAQEACIECAAKEVTKSITRAKLCEMKVCIDKAHASQETLCLYSATDSQACMQMVHGELWKPVKNVRCKHGVLVAAIAHQIVSRARRGLYTLIPQVKSHSGIKGNGMAD